MFEKLKVKLSEKFQKGQKYQLCYLYDEIMKHFKVDGIEGEQLARLVMHYLQEEEILIEIEMNMFYSDMFTVLEHFHEK